MSEELQFEPLGAWPALCAQVGPAAIRLLDPSGLARNSITLPAAKLNLRPTDNDHDERSPRAAVHFRRREHSAIK